MTSTYDHRIIQGAESGRFLQRIEAYLQGEDGFYERVFATSGSRRFRRSPQAPPRRRAAAAPPPPPGAAGTRARDEEMLQAVQAATSLLKAHRTHGHLAAKLDPLGREPEGDPALDPEPLGLTPGADGEDPGADPAHVRPGRDAGRGAARTCARPTAGRSRTRSSTSPPISSGCGCARRSSPGAFRKPLTTRRAEGAAQAADRGRRARALHAQGVPGPEAVLGRGPRHDRADARRADPAVRHPRRARGRDRDGPPRAAERARPQPRAARTTRSSPSSKGSSTLEPITTIPQGGTGDVKYHHGAQGSYQLHERRVDHRAARVEPEPPRVRRPGRRRARPAPRRRRARARTPTRTRTPRSR